jgi:hypothetical protein
MEQYESLNHTKWECKYHVVADRTPKAYLRFHKAIPAVILAYTW